MLDHQTLETLEFLGDTQKLRKYPVQDTLNTYCVEAENGTVHFPDILSLKLWED